MMRVDPVLAAFLADRDVPCPNPKCGFNLRGLTTGACPECHEPLRLVVARPEALWFMRKLVVAAAFLVALAGVGSLLNWLPTLIASNISAMSWSSWLFLCMYVGVALGVGFALVRYRRQSVRGDLRALPRLLASTLVATLIWFGLGLAWFLFRLAAWAMGWSI